MEEAAREREGCEKMRSKKDGRSKENVIVIVIARFQEEWNLDTDIQMLSSTRFIFREEENPRGSEIVGILINKTNPFSRSKEKFNLSTDRQSMNPFDANRGRARNSVIRGI